MDEYTLELLQELADELGRLGFEFPAPRNVRTAPAQQNSPEVRDLTCQQSKQDPPTLRPLVERIIDALTL